MDKETKIDYSEFVGRLVKPGDEINNDITPFRLELVHMILGISGEAGELLDAIKKYVIYNKPIDIENVVEEMGDIEFFLEGLRQLLKISREDCIDANIEKLSKRYRELSYSDKAAQERADKTKEPQKP